FYRRFHAGRVIQVDGKPMLQTETESLIQKYYYKRKGRQWLQADTRYWQRHFDTLTFYRSWPIEKSTSEWHTIDTLRFRLYGWAYGMELTVIGDSMILEKACEYRPVTPIDSGGMFTVRISGNKSRHLQELLNAIDFTHLKKAYYSPVRHPG